MPPFWLGGSDADTLPLFYGPPALDIIMIMWYIEGMKTEETETNQRPPQAMQHLQLSIVNMGDFIFHNKWFHSAGVKLLNEKSQLTVNLISPNGMAKGMTLVGTKEEIAQAYESLKRQVGTIDPQSLMAMQQEPPAPKEQPDGRNKEG